MTDSLTASSTSSVQLPKPYATTVMSSADAGWTSLLLYQLDNDPVAEDVVIEPSAHQHIVLVDSGRTVIQSRSRGAGWKRAEYAAGRIGLTPPGQGARLRWRGPHRHRTTHVCLPGSLLDTTAWELWGSAAPRMRRPDLLNTEDSLIVAVLAGLTVAARQGVGDLYAESAASLLAVHLLTRHTPAATGSPEIAAPGRESVRMKQVIAYLRDNQSRPVTLTEMAEVFGCSTFHFLRLFTAATGTTPHRYLVRLRLATARRYLERTDLSVTDIASLTGFATPSAFSAAFRSHLGTSPTALRRSLRPAPEPAPPADGTRSAIS